MPHYRRVGDVPRKRHTLHRHDGAVAFEELMGTDGFSGASALLYHRRSPSAIVRIEAVETPDPSLASEPAAAAASPAHRRARRPGRPADAVARAPTAARQRRRASSASSRPTRRARSTATRPATSSCTCTTATPCSRACSAGSPSRAGDYVVIPAATTHRWVVDVGRASCSIIAARGHVDGPRPVPQRERPAARGRAVQRARPARARSRTAARRRRGRAGARAHPRRAQPCTSTRTHPFDVVGWDGYLYPWAMSIHDFEPIVGRIHQPPPVHQTFAGPNFVVCSFVPRLFDFDPERGEGAVPPRERRHRRGALLLARRLHEPGRLGHRRRIDQPAPAGLRARPAARQPRAQRRRGPHRGARGDDRRVPAARPQRRGALAVSDPDYPFSWSR